MINYEEFICKLEKNKIEYTLLRFHSASSVEICATKPQNSYPSIGVAFSIWHAQEDCPAIPSALARGVFGDAA
jgi:hypothetical protein